MPAPDRRARMRIEVPLLAVAAWLLLTSLVGSPDAAQAASGYEYVSPVPGSQLVSRWNNIVIRPGAPLPRGEFGSGAVVVVGSRSGRHDGRLVTSDDGRTLIFTPARPFSFGERVHVRFEAAVRADEGGSLPPLEFEFEVSGSDPRRVSGLGLETLLGGEPGPAAAPRRAEPLASPNGTLANVCTPLPRDYPMLVVKTSDRPDPGRVFMSPFFGGSPVGRLLIVDNAGQPMFYRRLPAAAYDFKMQPGGLLTYFGERNTFWALDSSYAVVDSFQMGNGYSADLHDVQVLPSGHALMLAYDVQIVAMDSIVPGGHPNARVIGVVLQELDQAKNVVFQWRSWDHFQITDADTCLISLRDSVVDYVHANAIELDHDGNLLLSSRSMNEITKIDRATGDIIWRLGRNARKNQFSFPNDSRGFTGQHDIRRLPNGDITLFDNGNCRTPLYSRAVEYQLDEVNKVATQVWEYRNSPDTFGGFMGDVQRRANGGTMIGWGGTGADPKLTDLRADGGEGLELGLSFSSMWTYRAFRFPWTTTMFTLSADTLDFGKLPTRVTSDRSVTVRNRTSQTLTITCVQSTDPSFAVLTPVPFSIGPGGSWPVTVRVGTVTPQLLFGTLYIRTASDTSLVAQSAYMRARVVASLPAANRGLAGLLAAGLLGSGLWALRRRQAALAAALKRW